MESSEQLSRGQSVGVLRLELLTNLALILALIFIFKIENRKIKRDIPIRLNVNSKHFLPTCIVVRTLN